MPRRGKNQAVMAIPTGAPPPRARVVETAVALEPPGMKDAAAFLGNQLFNAMKEATTHQEPLYWQAKDPSHKVSKEITKWTNRAIMKQPRLLQVKGQGEKMIMREVEKRMDSLNSGDVFILDTGNMIYIWHGRLSNEYERKTAFEVVQYMRKSRGENTHYTVLEEANGADDCLNFWKEIRKRPLLFGRESPIGPKYKVKRDGKGPKDSDVKPFNSKLYPLKLKNNTIDRERRWLAKTRNGLKNQFARKKLESSKGFLLDDGLHLWVWVGQDAGARYSEDQLCKEAVKYLQTKSNHRWYKRSHDRPASLPIIVVYEGKEPEAFLRSFRHTRRPHWF